MMPTLNVRSGESAPHGGGHGLPARRPAPRHLAGPAIGTGVLMAAYLVLRPYGDAGTSDSETLRAFASPWWVIAHLCGVLALASFARLVLRVADLVPGLLAGLARWASLGGLVLVLPYYGAETFALHVLGRGAVAGDLEAGAALALVTQVQDLPAALVTFAVGLLLLAVGGLCLAAAWSRAGVGLPWGAWPLGVLMAALLPQFFLPPAGRMAFGVGYAAAALLVAVVALRQDRAPAAARS